MRPLRNGLPIARAGLLKWRRNKSDLLRCSVVLLVWQTTCIASLAKKRCALDIEFFDPSNMNRAI